MSSAAAIDARVDNLRSQELQTSFHGIAARLDRLPSGAFQRRAMWLIGGVCFCDCLDMNVGGPIIAELLASGWSDAGLNSLFVSITAFGYLCGGLMAGMVSDYFGRVRACIANTIIFSLGCLGACLAPDMYFLIAMRFLMGIGLGAAYPAGYSALTEYNKTWTISSMGRPHRKLRYPICFLCLTCSITYVRMACNLCILRSCRHYCRCSSY